MPWRAKSSARRRNCSSVSLSATRINRYHEAALNRRNAFRERAGVSIGGEVDMLDRNLLRALRPPRHFGLSGRVAQAPSDTNTDPRATAEFSSPTDGAENRGLS